MRADENGQVSSLWLVVQWNSQRAKRYPELHQWRRKRARLARGSGHLLVSRARKDGWEAALVDLDNACIMRAKASALGYCYRLLDTFLKLDYQGWFPLVVLPEFGNEPEEIRLVVPW
jgi:hypothetical protein